MPGIVQPQGQYSGVKWNHKIIVQQVQSRFLIQVSPVALFTQILAQNFIFIKDIQWKDVEINSIQY